MSRIVAQQGSAMEKLCFPHVPKPFQKPFLLAHQIRNGYPAKTHRRIRVRRRMRQEQEEEEFLCNLLRGKKRRKGSCCSGAVLPTFFLPHVVAGAMLYPF